MATDIMPSMDWMPDISSFQVTPEIFNKILIGTMIVIVVFFLWQQSRYRILVEINEKVKGGVVPKYGRYRQVYDYAKQMYDLRPMRGKEALPSYPSNYYQKIKGLPFIGPKRFLCLMRLNKYSYAVITPDTKNDNGCNFEEYNSKPWVYKDVEKKYKARIMKKNLMGYLMNVAPLVVIVAGFVLIGFGIWQEYQLFIYLGQKIEYAINLICTVATTP